MTRRAAAIWASIPFLAAALVFSGTRSLDFALDDVPLVRDNPSIRDLSRLPALFGEPYWATPGEDYGLYRPVTVASLALNRALTGEGPAGFHLGNVLLHAIASALAWFVARKIGVHYGTALAASLLFAVHPLRVEAVANVAGRAEVLAALLVLAAWLSHRRAAETEGGAATGFSLLAGLLWLAAVLSKESAILAPVVFAADDLLRGRGKRERSRAPGAAWGAYALAAFAALVLRSNALDGLGGPAATVYLDNPAAFEGTFPRIATALWVHVRYLGLLLWPATLSSDYSFDAIPVVASFADPRLWAGGLVAATLAGAFAWTWKRGRRTEAIALLAWAAFLLPGSNLFFATGTVMGERLTYLPAFGAFLLAGHGLAALAAAGEKRGVGRATASLAVALGAALTIACAARSLLRIPAWKNNLTLATTDVLAFPRSAKLQAGAGIFLAAEKRYEEAEPHLKEAVRIWPDYAQARYNLSVLLLARGANEEGIDHLLRANALAPGNPSPVRLLEKFRDDPRMPEDLRRRIRAEMRGPQAPAAR